MRLRARIRAVDFSSLLFLLLVVGLGVLQVYGLVRYLAADTGFLVEPERVGDGLLKDGVELILFAAALIWLVVERRRQRVLPASWWQENRYLSRAMFLLFLSAVLTEGLPFVALFSLTLAWYLEPAVLVVGILASVLLLGAFARGEISLWKKPDPQRRPGSSGADTDATEGTN